MSERRHCRIPRSAEPAELGFEPQPMVCWFAPGQLLRAGIKALLSTLFGAYADKREIQAALAPAGDLEGLLHDELAGEPELWVDYVADSGDGFAPTYAIARLCSEPALALSYDGQRHATQRGQLLVLGGDQVYPTATREEYWNRFGGPYSAALPHVPEGERTPRMLAIPGNHDWYDGLTSFLRLFCQPGRWIGGWRTWQRRSYFAVDLGRGWWLWGIDIQLGSDVDQPQLDFFHHVAEHCMAGGSKQVVLCSAEPSWVYHELRGPEHYRNLQYFEDRVIRAYGHDVAVGLSGDLHTYARYQQRDGRRQLFVAGGGGAYLYPAHDLPRRLRLPLDSRSAPADEQSGEPEQPRADGWAEYERCEPTAPSSYESQRLTRGALRFARINPRFSAFLGALYLFYAWIVQSASKMLDHDPHGSFLELASRTAFGLRGFAQVAAQFAQNLAHSPFSLLALGALFGVLIGYADLKRRPLARALLGCAHASVHVALLIALMWGAAGANLALLRLGVDDPLQVVLFSAALLGVGGALGGSVIGAYLYLTNRWLHIHSNDVLSCQSIPHHKQFLRLHRDAAGDLHIYPIGLDRVPDWPHGWRFDAAQAREGRPWFEPVEGPLSGSARLLEKPIRVAGRGDAKPSATEDPTELDEAGDWESSG